MGEREIIQLMSSSSASDERDEEGEGGEEEEEEEDCILSTNNTNKDENKEEDKREKSIRGGAGGGPSYSNCSFPMSRIKRLVKNEGVLHFRTTPEFVFLINKASEQFLELFAEDAYACAVRERKKSLNYEHLCLAPPRAEAFMWLALSGKVSTTDNLRRRGLTSVAISDICVLCGKVNEMVDHLFVHSSVVTKEKRYEFLSDFVPEKVRAKDALSVKSLNES